MSEIDLVIGGWSSPQQAFQVETGAAILGTCVGDELGFLGTHLLDVVEGGQERPLLISDQFGCSDDPHGIPAGGDLHGLPDQPLLVSNDDASSGCKHSFRSQDSPFISGYTNRQTSNYTVLEPGSGKPFRYAKLRLFLLPMACTQLSRM